MLNWSYPSAGQRCQECKAYFFGDKGYGLCPSCLTRQEGSARLVVTVRSLVHVFRSLMGIWRSAEHFHLRPCACGAPSWQQPCPFCGFYPMGDDPEERARVAGTMTREKFHDAIHRAGGFAKLFAQQPLRTCLPKHEAEALKKRLEDATVAWVLPVGNEIWDAFTGPKDKVDLLNGWRA